LGIFSKFYPQIKNLAVTDEKAWDKSLWRLAGSQSLSGENVNEYTALNYSAVYNAVSLISGTVSTLPLHLLQTSQNKQKKAVNKKLYNIMGTKPNPYMTSGVFREVGMAHLLLWGNWYSEIVRNRVGDVVELWPITPDRIAPKMREDQLIYEIKVNGDTVILPRERILHIPGLGWDGFMGYSVVAMARKSIGLGMAMETFGAQYFGNGTHPGVIISHPGPLSPQAHANLKTSLSDTYSGLGQSHRLMLLEEGMKMESINIPPEDSQFLESRQFQIPEIARWFNLPPHKLKDLSRSSFNNIESEQISFVTDSILPWLVRLEQHFNVQLLSDRELNNEKLYFKHNVEGLLRGDAKSRGEYYRSMFNIGAMSLNDIREKEEMDAIDNEFADEHFVPVNMVPLNMVREVFSSRNKQLSQPTKSESSEER
jgi:HK97 family phage portal protein